MTEYFTSNTDKPYRLAILSTHPIQYFSPLYKRLAQEKNIDLTVFYCSRQGLATYYDTDLGIKFKWDVPLLDGYHAEFLPDIRGNIPTDYSSKRLQPAIFKIILQGQYDALWLYGYKNPTYWLAIIAAKISRTALLIRTDAQLNQLRLHQHTWRSRLRPTILRFVFKLFDGALAIGTNNAAYYKAHGMPNHKIFIAPYAVNNTFFMAYNDQTDANLQQMKTELGIHPSLPVVISVGKLVANKQPFLLLEAFIQARRESHTDAVLIFLGDGELRPLLAQYCKKNKVENIIFAGFVNQSRLPKYYAIADILVLPSLQEAWGLVVNEAMCAKNAIIVSDAVGAAADLVLPEENGFIFPSNDKKALVQYLITLLNDPVLRQRMGQRSLEIIKQWGLNKTVTGIIQAIAHTSKKSRIR